MNKSNKWVLREAVVTYRKGNHIGGINHGRIASSRDVSQLMHTAPALCHIPDSPQEYFVTIALNVKNHVIGFEIVSKGNMSACPVDAGNVFRGLLLQCAAATIFVHNHPSGDPSPSPDDIALTGRLCKAGELLGVKVQDHVILGDEGYYSFLDTGILQGS